MAQFATFLVSLCMLLHGIRKVEGSDDDGGLVSGFCACFMRRRSNWVTGHEARVCFRAFDHGFAKKGKNETCNPAVDAELCKRQRMRNLALKYCTDLEEMDKFVGRYTPNGVLRTGVTKTNKVKLIKKYEMFFQYHPLLLKECASYDFDKWRILKIMSTLSIGDIKSSYPNTQELPDAYAITKAFMLGKQLQTEVNRVCDEDATSDFCLEMRAMGRIMPKLEDLLTNTHNFGRTLQNEALNAFKLNFVPFVFKYPQWTDIQPSRADQQGLFDEFTEKIVTFMVNRDFGSVLRIMRFLPSFGDMTDCKTYENGDYCLFKSTTDQLSQYLQRRNARQKRLQKTDQFHSLKSYIDYKSYMNQFWLQAILENLRSSKDTFRLVKEFLTEETAEITSGRMNELKGYFQQVEGYNQRIASADMAYLEGMMKQSRTGLSKEKTTVLNLLDELKDKLYGVNIHTLWWEIFGVLGSFATSMDPRKWLQGNGAADLVDSINNVLAAGASLREGDALHQSFIKTSKELSDIYSKLLDNKYFLQNVEKILPSSELDISSEEYNNAKKIFLEKYAEYTPAVQKSEITKTGESLNNIIDQLCGMLEDATGPWAYKIAGEIHYEGKCYKLMSAVATMTSYCEQLYEFQFEYMDAMAEYMRTSTAMVAARDINAHLADGAVRRRTGGDKIRLMRSLAVSAFLTHEIQKWQIMEEYCDTLEYRNGGLRPDVCQEESTNFPSLMAHIPKECDSDVEQIVDIPAQQWQSIRKADPSTLSLNSLLSGSEVVFQVPNTDWLIKNNWITKRDARSSIFVKNFELFVPAFHRGTKKIRTEVTAVTSQLYPNGPIYGIKPKPMFVSEYEKGSADEGCKLPLMLNPYSTCKDDLPQPICKRTKSPTDDNFQTSTKYPSIFSSWLIKVFGYQNYNPNVFATAFSIKAKVQLCKIRKRIPETISDSDQEGGRSSSDDESGEQDSGETESRENFRSKDPWGCCYGAMYFNAIANKCDACPEGSSKGLKGYGCFYKNRAKES